MPTSQSASERRARRIAERIELHVGPERSKPLADRLVGERGDPQPPGRRAAARELIDVAKDQLALAPGVACVDDRGEPPVGQELHDGAQLGRGVPRWAQPKLGRHHGSVSSRHAFHRPSYAAGSSSSTRWPTHHVMTRPVALEAVLPGGAYAEHAGEIPRDGRLLRDDQLQPRELTEWGCHRTMRRGLPRLKPAVTRPAAGATSPTSPIGLANAARSRFVAPDPELPRAAPPLGRSHGGRVPSDGARHARPRAPRHRHRRLPHAAGAAARVRGQILT